MATQAQRDHMKALGKLFLDHEPQLHYLMRRPMGSINLFEIDVARILIKGSFLSFDCSESVTLICKLAGLKDPNRTNYNGRGNTQMMLDALPHYTDAKAAQVGALAIYGIPGVLQTQHVAFVYNTDPHDPMMWSMGQEKGPLLVRHSVEKTAHHNRAVFLNIKDL